MRRVVTSPPAMTIHCPFRARRFLSSPTLNHLDPDPWWIELHPYAFDIWVHTHTHRKPGALIAPIMYSHYFAPLKPRQHCIPSPARKSLRHKVMMEEPGHRYVVVVMSEISNVINREKDRILHVHRSPQVLHWRYPLVPTHFLSMSCPRQIGHCKFAVFPMINLSSL